MKKYLQIPLLLVFILTGMESAFAQDKKIWVSGAARGIMYGDDYKASTENDTTTARKLQSGHAMVDLGVNIQPNKNLLIQGMVRVRNDYGGFWGSGVTFDVRQLYIKGIIADFLKYQLGDINYKLSPYTFSNQGSLVNKYAGQITGVPLEQVEYDLFYTPDQTWRQQGAAIDFALEFSSLIQEMEFNAFTTRIRPSNFDTQDDRLYSGGSVVLVQSDFLKIGGQYVNLYDFQGTSNSTVFLRNPVATGSLELGYDISNSRLSLGLEAGQSTMQWEGDAAAPVLEDFFYDVTLKWVAPKPGLMVKAGFREVGPNFRSAGSQTMRINYQSAPQAYQRYGNAQNLRNFGLLDLSRDASLYQAQIVAGLMTYDPRYDNANPYGIATPNRRGFNAEVQYVDPKNRWEVGADGDFSTQIVGEGTNLLTGYTTGSVMAKLNIAPMMGWEERVLSISGRVGQQMSSRSGGEVFEDIDLSTSFSSFNLEATIIGKLDVIGEYRTWKSDGFTLVEERNAYSQIVDFTEYDINYSEDIAGAGLRYSFSEKTALRLMWQTYAWKDELQSTLPYTIDTWNLFFTMRF